MGARRPQYWPILMQYYLDLNIYPDFVQFKTSKLEAN